MTQSRLNWGAIGTFVALAITVGGWIWSMAQSSEKVNSMGMKVEDALADVKFTNTKQWEEIQKVSSDNRKNDMAIANTSKDVQSMRESLTEIKTRVSGMEVSQSVLMQSNNEIKVSQTYIMRQLDRQMDKLAQ